MKITLQTVIDALGHCDDKQEKEFIYNLNNGLESWAGIGLGKMIDEYMESLDEESPEDKLHLPARNLA